MIPPLIQVTREGAVDRRPPQWHASFKAAAVGGPSQIRYRRFLARGRLSWGRAFGVVNSGGNGAARRSRS